jgi:hypothetical protein
VPTYSLRSVTPGIWQKFSYAKAGCLVLDGRSQRDPDGDPDNANKSVPMATILPLRSNCTLEDVFTSISTLGVAEISCLPLVLTLTVPNGTRNSPKYTTV